MMGFPSLSEWSGVSERSRRGRRGVVAAVVLVAAAIVTAVPTAAQTEQEPEPLEVTVTTVVSGLSNPWDVDFLPVAPHTMVFTERAGTVNVWRDGAKHLLYAPGDVHVLHEGGVLGLAVDPDWATNRYLYVCMTTSADVRVMRLRTNPQFSAIEQRTDIVTGIPRGTQSWHVGCRVGIQPGTGALFVTTGDSNTGSVPQNLNSLGGKTLRVTRDGAPFPGNPHITHANTNRQKVYTHGHRNPQGLVFRPGTNQVFNSEHGPNYSDEVNRLVPGGNYGWDPGPTGYNQNVPMTDLIKFPTARAAVWTSGELRTGPSGATFVTGSQWKEWEGRLAVAHLSNRAGRYASIMTLDGNGDSLLDIQQVLGHLDYRLRTIRQGPDGDLYITTDRVGGNPPFPREGLAPGSDMILRVSPVEDSEPPNEPPTADFEWSSDFLEVSFVSTSTDDSEIVSHSWNFGDGATTGDVDPTHTYETDGVYDVTLTVTDDGGETDVASAVVTVSDGYANDAFERTESGGWGDADFGGSWLHSGPASSFSVSDGAGKITGAAGSTRSAFLSGVDAADVELTADITLDTQATGDGATFEIIGRRDDDGNDYRLRVWYRNDGTVVTALVRTAAGVPTVLNSRVVPGLVVDPHDELRVRFQVTGTTQPWLEAEVWSTDAPKPDGSLFGTWDTAAPIALQGAGHVGLSFGVAQDWSGTLPTFGVDDFDAGRSTK